MRLKSNIICIYICTFDVIFVSGVRFTRASIASLRFRSSDWKSLSFSYPSIYFNSVSIYKVNIFHIFKCECMHAIVIVFIYKFQFLNLHIVRIADKAIQLILRKPFSRHFCSIPLFLCLCYRMYPSIHSSGSWNLGFVYLVVV